MLGRRLRILALAAVLALVTAACSSAVATSELSGPGWVHGSPHGRPGGIVSGTPPNIVFVLTDDLSWNLVTYMPHVVAMEHDGVTFPDYFVTDSLCCPSRTSIFTGEFPHNDGVFGNTGPTGGFNAFLSHGDAGQTFASVLQARGYQTGLFGKFLNAYRPGSTYRGQLPYVPPGWSAWDVANQYGYEEYGYTLAMGHRLALYGSQPRDYLTSVMSNKASQFIAASAKAHLPFLAEISTFAPHEPFVPAPADVGTFPHLLAPHSPAFGHAAITNPPEWLKRIPPLTATDRASINQAFLASRVEDVQSVDRMIGHLEDEVRRLGLSGNTYFVFSSDNGLHLGEHNLRQGKETAFDTDIRVPLIVTGPGVPGDRSIQQLTENIDLAPTFESLAGATPPATVDGHSLLAQLHGNQPAGWRSAVLVEHHGPDVSPSDPDFPAHNSGNPPSYEAIRTAGYLYVEYKDGQREFYNLAADPYELDNRYDVMPPAVKRQLHDTLLRMERCHGATQCWAAQHLTR